MNGLTFTLQTLVGTNKVGNVKIDSEGYGEFVLGAFGVKNSIGAMYDTDILKDFFGSNQLFINRVSKGRLRGENGHPKQMPGETDEQFAYRCMSINEARISHMFKEIRLTTNEVKDDNGNFVIAVVGKAKPDGELYYVLEKAMKNKDGDICFSIRSFTDDYYHRGVRHKKVRQIITWDIVNDPGISVATKFKAPNLENSKLNIGLESESYPRDIYIPRDSIIQFANQKGSNSMGFESQEAQFNAKELCSIMGWGLREIQAFDKLSKW